MKSKRASRFMALLLSLLMAFGFNITVNAAGPFSGGTGSPGDPYIITTPEELNQVRDYLDSYFILGNDIDLTTYLSPGNPGYNDGQGWNPISNYFGDELIFVGGLDGGGYKITGLWINRNAYMVGLFGCVVGATFKNLGIELAEAGIVGNDSVGGLAGTFGGVAENCYVKGNVEGLLYIGGLVGTLFNGGLVNGNFYDNAGILSSCYAEGSVTGRGLTGGLVGMQVGINQTTSYITNCYATGDVFSDFNSGGLVGMQHNGVITNCYASGNVVSQGTDDYFVQSVVSGGLVGRQYIGSVANSFAAGDIISSYSDGDAGGIVGSQIEYDSEGFEGPISGEILNCYRYEGMSLNGAVSAIDTPDGVMGGIKTALELRTQATYENSGWDFDDVWEMVPGFDYPQLRDMSEPKPFIYGDVNNDGVVDMIDSILLSRYIAEWGNVIDLRAADVNDDGVVDMLDAIIMARHIAEWPGYETLPVKPQMPPYYYYYTGPWGPVTNGEGSITTAAQLVDWVANAKKGEILFIVAASSNSPFLNFTAANYPNGLTIPDGVIVCIRTQGWQARFDLGVVTYEGSGQIRFGNNPFNGLFPATNGSPDGTNWGTKWTTNVNIIVPMTVPNP